MIRRTMLACLMIVVAFWTIQVVRVAAGPAASGNRVHHDELSEVSVACRELADEVGHQQLPADVSVQLMDQAAALRTVGLDLRRALAETNSIAVPASPDSRRGSELVDLARRLTGAFTSAADLVWLFEQVDFRNTEDRIAALTRVNGRLQDYRQDLRDSTVAAAAILPTLQNSAVVSAGTDLLVRLRAGDSLLRSALINPGPVR